MYQNSSGPALTEIVALKTYKKETSNNLAPNYFDRHCDGSLMRAGKNLTLNFLSMTSSPKVGLNQGYGKRSTTWLLPFPQTGNDAIFWSWRQVVGGSSHRLHDSVATILLTELLFCLFSLVEVTRLFDFSMKWLIRLISKMSNLFLV